MAECPDGSADWVELLRVHDGLEAETLVGMLKDHDVPVRTYGGATTALPTIGLTDVRILVPRADRERAEQVLAAMRGGLADVHPFRDAPAEPYEAPVRKRRGPQLAWTLLALTLAYTVMTLLRR
jgi:Putative prokaryotic signal transducing protein